MHLSIHKPLEQKGFTFAEVLITLSLFLILASIGVGAYFRYYSLSLTNREIALVRNALRETKFKAMKNPYNSNYGIYLDVANNQVVSFRNTYVPGAPENEAVELEQMGITNIDLQPSPGTTHEVIFENITGKTVNSGTFTIGRENQNYEFNINIQGVFE